MRVAAVQFEAGTDAEVNLATCLRMLDQAAATGAQLIVLPEFCNHLSWYADRADARRQARREGDAFLTAIGEAAKRHGVYVKINVTYAHEDGRTGGTNLLFDPAGAVIGRCDKQTLMGSENDFLDPAIEVGPIIDTPLGRLGMYACMEGVMTEIARGLALRGGQILLNSLNSFALDEASLHIPVRAAENKVWVVAANKVGPLLPTEHLPAVSARLGVPPEWLHGAGESQIVAPDGTVVAKAPRTGEAVVVADIDPAAADDKRRPDGTDSFAVRRPALYAALATEPTGRTRPAGAEKLAVAVVRDGAAGVKEQALAGVELIVLPPLAATPEELAAALSGTKAHAVTTVIEDGVPYGVVVGAAGEVARQPQLHASAAFPLIGGAPSDTQDVCRVPLQTIDLEWGRLAVIIGDDAIQPEVFRLAAIADCDVVAVPFVPQEPWETSLGLLERSAENRLNVVAAAPLGQPSLILGLSPDFTLWTEWEGPFTGRISHPLVTRVDSDQASAQAVVSPAQAANRFVSKQTNLVDGRPWRLLGALTQ